MIEEWRKIKGFNEYEISNFGRVKSLSRLSRNRYNSFLTTEKILTANIGYGGYRFQKLNNKTFAIHRLVAIAFLGDIDHNKIVNHKDLNQLNNRVDNLEIITHRENSHHYLLSQNKTSKYIGVSFDKSRCKWTAKIKVKGKTINLGRFNEEIDAKNKYLEYAEIKGLSSKYSK